MLATPCRKHVGATLKSCGVRGSQETRTTDLVEARLVGKARRTHAKQDHWQASERVDAIILGEAGSQQASRLCPEKFQFRLSVPHSCQT